MPACAIRYRRNSSGPAAYLVEYDGRLHVYSNGVLGAAWPGSLDGTSTVARDFGWVPVKGELVVDVPVKTRRPDERRRDDAVAVDRAAPPPTSTRFEAIGEAFFA